MQNSIFSTHYANYLKMLANNNNKLISKTLSELEIQNLYSKEYKLNEFEIYLYITVLDSVSDSLGCSKIKLTEGITSEVYKYRNILVDLYYQNIPHVICISSISEIFELDIEWGDNVEVWDNDDDYYEHYGLNENWKYSGNSFTYYIFKQLIKLLLNEVYLYKFKGTCTTSNKVRI